jgi:endonuclease/exonuclease/phosphatase family metal-dependent hydrolase
MPARRFAGCFFCVVLAAGVFACGKRSGSPDWDTPGGTAPTAVSTAESGRTKAKPRAAAVAANETRAVSTQAGPTSAANGNGGPRFIAYNVENWLTMDRFVNNKSIKSAPKPDEEKKAVIRILVANQPDVVGICEIGEASDLAEIRESLKASGLNLPHSHYTGGTDPVRHLGLLSRYPIHSTAKAVQLEYRMSGQTFGFNRGVLDATVNANGKSYRFLGVHLKSKRDVEEGDQEQMRINEAHLLRKHVDAVFEADPQARLLVYGDFNDTYPSKAVKAITGSQDESRRLSPIYLKDSRGEAWTHHWKNQDIYSRIDFVTVSRALRSEVDFKASRIIEDAGWDTASDHRALMVVFK